MPAKSYSPQFAMVMACAILACPLPAKATGRQPEYLVIDGQTSGLSFALPLEPVLRSGSPGAIEFKKQLRLSCSALWRGYHGTWEVKDGALYLVSLTSCSFKGDLKTALFPEASGPIKATWVTARLLYSVGTTMPYAHLRPETELRHIDVFEGKVLGDSKRFTPRST
jgi:hypothetical protein